MNADIQLQRDVLDELEWEPSVNAAQIGVASKNGVVTLTGTVATFAEKMAAEKAAKRVRGVKAMVEQIEVKIPSAMKRTDADIARAALDALAWHVEVPSHRIKVKVENGWLTLEGELEWAFQRDAALRSVRYLTGVSGVTNLLTIKPRVETTAIKSKIAEAFKRNAELEAGRIKVQAVGGRVTLDGKVQNWLERDEAARIAWAAPGVIMLENRITVSP